MAKQQQEVYLVDACRTAFGKARPDGFFGLTRADDMVVKVIRSLVHRNPDVDPSLIDDNIWGATTQNGNHCLLYTSPSPRDS